MRVRVGIIGCGYWGPQLVRNFAEMPESSLVAVSDRVPDRLAKMRLNNPGVATFLDYRDLLERDVVDAVAIATPIQTHFEIAKAALQAGKHVLVEKPLAENVAEALELVSLAQANNLVLMVGHTFLYNPAVHALRQIVQEEDFGRVFYVDAARLNLGLFQRHANVLWDLAPHDISILGHILDVKPVAVSATGSIAVQQGIHDVAYLNIEFANGVHAHIHVSWLDPAKVRRITVVGERRMVVYNDVSLQEKIRIYDKGVDQPMTDTFGEFQLSYRHGPVTIPYIEWQEPLRIECQHFCECIVEGIEPVTSGWHGLEVVAVLEAANQSLMNGHHRREIRLPAAFSPKLQVDDLLPGNTDLEGSLAGPSSAAS